MKEYLFAGQHMGTTVHLSFVCTDAKIADKLALTTFRVITEYEKRFSRFLPESELSKLNHSKSELVSQEFFNLLIRSQELASLTKENFNPLLQVSKLGYELSYPHYTNSSTRHKEAQTYNTDFSTVTIDHKSHRATLKADQQLDFGGILKGYLAAQLADQIMRDNSSCIGCIINIGGDITTRGVDEFHKPFIFLLYNPITQTEYPVTILNASLASSGIYKRQWIHAGLSIHHIVDSATKRNPSTDIVAVSIQAEDGALTEALTKLFMTRGVTQAVTIVPPTKYHYHYFVVYSNGTITSSFL